MKQFLVSLVGIVLMFGACQGYAQELTQNRKVATFAPGLSAPVGAATQKKIVRQAPKYARTTILRFEPGQTDLSDVQKELLLRLAERLAQKRGGNVVATAASKSMSDSTARVRAIEEFLKSYAYTQYIYSARFIKPEHVVPSMDNTVKIVEKR